MSIFWGALVARCRSAYRALAASLAASTSSASIATPRSRVTCSHAAMRLRASPRRRWDSATHRLRSSSRSGSSGPRLRRPRPAGSGPMRSAVPRTASAAASSSAGSTATRIVAPSRLAVPSRASTRRANASSGSSCTTLPMNPTAPSSTTYCVGCRIAQIASASSRSWRSAVRMVSEARAAGTPYVLGGVVGSDRLSVAVTSSATLISRSHDLRGLRAELADDLRARNERTIRTQNRPARASRLGARSIEPSGYFCVLKVVSARPIRTRVHARALSIRTPRTPSARRARRRTPHAAAHARRRARHARRPRARLITHGSCTSLPLSHSVSPHSHHVHRAWARRSWRGVSWLGRLKKSARASKTLDHATFRHAAPLSDSSSPSAAPAPVARAENGFDVASCYGCLTRHTATHANQLIRTPAH